MTITLFEDPSRRDQLLKIVEYRLQNYNIEGMEDQLQIYEQIRDKENAYIGARMALIGLSCEGIRNLENLTPQRNKNPVFKQVTTVIDEYIKSCRRGDLTSALISEFENKIKELQTSFPLANKLKHYASEMVSDSHEILDHMHNVNVAEMEMTALKLAIYYKPTHVEITQDNLMESAKVIQIQAQA